MAPALNTVCIFADNAFPVRGEKKKTVAYLGYDSFNSSREDFGNLGLLKLQLS